MSHSIDVNGNDSTPEWGFCTAEGCREDAFPIWQSGDFPDEPDYLLCPKHIGACIRNLSLSIGELHTTIGYQDAMLRRAAADAGWLRGLVRRAIAHLDSFGEISTPRAAMAEDLEVKLAKTGDAGAQLLTELEAARVVVAAARQWMAQDTSLLPIEKTDWIAVGAIIDAVRAYDAAAKARSE